METTRGTPVEPPAAGRQKQPWRAWWTKGAPPLCPTERYVRREAVVVFTTLFAVVFVGMGVAVTMHDRRVAAERAALEVKNNLDHAPVYVESVDGVGEISYTVGTNVVTNTPFIYETYHQPMKFEPSQELLMEFRDNAGTAIMSIR